MNRLFILNQKREFNQRLEAIRDRLYRLAYSWSHNPDLADDLVQDTLAKALKSRHQLQSLEGFDKWVFKILINNWRNHLTRDRAMENIDDIILSDDSSPEKEHERQHITDYVKRAVATLPQGQRCVLTLVDLEGLSYAEVSGVLGIPIGTVMSRLCRARKALAELLLGDQAMLHAQEPLLRRIK